MESLVRFCVRFHIVHLVASFRGWAHAPAIECRAVGVRGGLEEWRGILAFFGVKLGGTRYKARLAFAMLCATLRNGFVYRVNGDSSMDDVETELHSAS